MSNDYTVNPDYVPPDLFALGSEYSTTIHAAEDEERTLCNVTTWGQYTRYDEPPEDRKLCNNCSLILQNRGTYQNSEWGARWLERRRQEERG